MEIKQIYALLNDVTQQALGTKAVSMSDLTGLVSLGNTILNSDTTKEKWLNVLTDRIGKTIVSARAYSAGTDRYLKNTFEYGAILQKVYIAPMDAEENTSHKAEGVSVDMYVIKNPEVKQKLFSDVTAWEIDVTIPDRQLKGAFVSESAMASFIGGIFTAIENSMELKLENMSNMCVANFIGERLWAKANGNGALTVVNLLADYKTATGDTTLTAANALYSSNFLKYSSSQMSRYLERMEKMSKLFNTEEYSRFTKKEDAIVTVLSEYASNYKFYLESDTYHKELVSLPNYGSIPYWQGTGTTYSFNDTSKIDVTTSAGHHVTQAGVIALITDRDALGIFKEDKKTLTAYNGKGEYTNYFNKAEIGYFNDLSENGVVFVVADTIFTV